MKEAAYYNVLEENNIQCILCPHKCYIKPGERGKCLVRLNDKGALIAENYGLISSIHFDPIEKKPLYHYYPGSEILSIGTVGCNLSCGFCQNCEISQKRIDEYPGLIPYNAPSLVEIARKGTNNIGIAYTYNEPVIYYEYVIEIAKEAASKGLKNVMVSNGFIETDPLKELLNVMDAFNIDLKSFSGKFYKDHTGGRLKPILKSLELIRESGKHLELTNLLIPGLNDDPKTFKEMISWIRDHLGKNTILHLSKYHPAYQYKIPATPEGTMKRLYSIAKEELNFVYLGNLLVNSGSNTICPNCNKILIARTGYNTKIVGINSDMVCKSCQSELSEFFTF